MSVRALERAAVSATRRLALLAGGVLLVMAALTVADATLRYGFSRPLPGTFELTELVLAAVIFFGLPYAGLTDGHVTVDILSGRLRPRGRALLEAFGALVTAALLAVITYQMIQLGAEYLRSGRTSITARIPVFPFMAPVIVAAALATLCALVQAAAALARAADPYPDA